MPVVFRIFAFPMSCAYHVAATQERSALRGTRIFSGTLEYGVGGRMSGRKGFGSFAEKGVRSDCKKALSHQQTPKEAHKRTQEALETELWLRA